MTKIKRSRALRVGPAPAWIKNKGDQEEWISRFVSILKRDFRDSNSAISLILENKDLAQSCATKIRSYVDKRATAWLYADRKARGARYKLRLEIAIAGIHEAITLYAEQKKYEIVANLRIYETELLGGLERCKTAFAPKRHGRDRDHSILIECRCFLEEELGKRLTDATLADLVYAGLVADGNDRNELITEEHIRKNLAEFTRNNPYWSNQINPNLTMP
jgi:hypothetical protein